MSNRMIIAVTEFSVNGTEESTFGFTAADDYFKAYEDHYDSLEEFFKEFPSEQDLIEYITWLPEFEGNEWGGVDGTPVMVDGY